MSSPAFNVDPASLTLEQAVAWYVQYVGYDPIADEPRMTLSDLRLDIQSYQQHAAQEETPADAVEHASTILDRLLAPCGLNADWSVRAWAMGDPAAAGFFILDTEEGDRMELVYRHAPDADGNCRIASVAAFPACKLVQALTA